MGERSSFDKSDQGHKALTRPKLWVVGYCSNPNCIKAW